MVSDLYFDAKSNAESASERRLLENTQCSPCRYYQVVQCARRCEVSGRLVYPVLCFGTGRPVGCSWLKDDVLIVAGNVAGEPRVCAGTGACRARQNTRPAEADTLHGILRGLKALGTQHGSDPPAAGCSICSLPCGDRCSGRSSIDSSMYREIGILHSMPARLRKTVGQ